VSFFLASCISSIFALKCISEYSFNVKKVENPGFFSFCSCFVLYSCVSGGNIPNLEFI